MTTAGTEPIESHDVHSERLIRHAEEKLAEGDRLQASEKAWGAVAHRLKVIAQRRGWEYTTHAHVYRVVKRLADERGDRRISVLFRAAKGFHQNYYIDAMPLEELTDEMENVKELLRLLKLNSPKPNPRQPPRNPNAGLP